MAVGQIVLGLLVERSDHAGSIVQRYEELVPGGVASELIEEPSPVLFRKDGSIQRAKMPSTASKVAAALLSLQERELIESAGARSVSSEEGMDDTVYAITSAGRAYFEWWMNSAAALDPLGNELRARLMFSTESYAPRLIELAQLQEQVCLDRLDELRGADERMTFARCTSVEELWEAMTAGKEPMHLQLTVGFARELRTTIETRLAPPGPADPGMRTHQ
jgi:hypothetical protein